MIERLKSWVSGLKGEPEEKPADYEDHHVAAAALLVEAAWMDGDFSDTERALVRDLLASQFELEDDECQRLLSEAETRHEASNEIFKFAYQVRQANDEEAIKELLTMIWQTVLTDGAVHDLEASLMRRLAGLLHVTDVTAGAARKAALARLGRSE